MSSDSKSRGLPDMWAQDQEPESCYKCRFASECSHVKNLAFTVVFKIRNLAKGSFFFEHAAKVCKSYQPERRTKKIKSGTQLNLF